ncbi:MAG: hypothetical protein IT443_03550 [Phycisphaeraceae bacterium]|nr:hypothetical protein [Phycisphaeraceae bacterium]
MTYRVRDDLPSGNVADVHIDENASLPRIAFSAHPRGGPEALWFHFRVERTGAAAGAEGQLQLVLKHYLSLAYTSAELTDSMRPVLRSPYQDWQRLDAPQRIDLPDGQIDLTWTVPAPAAGAWIEVAFCYPYTPDDLARLIDQTGGYWRADAIGLSATGEPITRLSNRYAPPAAAEPGIYLIARQHAGETPGGWVLDGLLRALAAAGDTSPLTWVVPIADVDGCVGGDYGKDQFPYDLNRAWGRPAMRHEVLVLQHDLRRWAQRCRPALALDFHAPGACENTGVYCYPPDPDDAPKRRALADPWLERLREALGEYAAGNFARVAKYRSRWETPDFCEFVGLELGCPAVAIETCYALAGAGKILLTRQSYQDIGCRLAKAIVRHTRE